MRLNCIVNEYSCKKGIQNDDDEQGLFEVNLVIYVAVDFPVHHLKLSCSMTTLTYYVCMYVGVTGVA